MFTCRNVTHVSKLNFTADTVLGTYTFTYKQEREREIERERETSGALASICSMISKYLTHALWVPSKLNIKIFFIQDKTSLEKKQPKRLFLTIIHVLVGNYLFFYLATPPGTFKGETCVNGFISCIG